MPCVLRLFMGAMALAFAALAGQDGSARPEAAVPERPPTFAIDSEGLFSRPPFTVAAIRLVSRREDELAAVEELASWLLIRHYAQRLLGCEGQADDPVCQFLLKQAPLQVSFSGPRFEQQSADGQLFYLVAADDRSVRMASRGALVTWCLKQGDPRALEAAIRLTAPLSLPARKQALDRLRSGSLRPPEHCRHLVAVRELVAEHQPAVMQYGIAEAKLGNRAEAEQAKAVAQAWSSIPAGAFRTIAGSLGLGPAWESRSLTNAGMSLHIQDMIGGSASVLSETHDVDADGWLYRAKAALELRSPICALLAARRAIALGKHEAAALAATACDQLGLAHSAQAYRAWPSLFKDP